MACIIAGQRWPHPGGHHIPGVRDQAAAAQASRGARPAPASGLTMEAHTLPHPPTPCLARSGVLTFSR